MYVCGGFNGSECLNSGEVYDPETNQWTFILPMICSRSGLGVVAYEGEIYALGGFNSVARMNSAEKYCPRTEQWTPIADFCSPRSNFAVEVRILYNIAILQFQCLEEGEERGLKIDFSPVEIQLLDFVGTYG